MSISTQGYHMKSIMEQASSIMKAIEKAWISADNPTEFSVKIFEKEEKNFFGMTTTPAKIGIFFSEKNNAPQEKQTQKAVTEAKEQRTEEKTHRPSFTKTPTSKSCEKIETKQAISKASPEKVDTKLQKPITSIKQAPTTEASVKTKNHSLEKHNNGTAQSNINNKQHASIKPELDSMSTLETDESLIKNDKQSRRTPAAWNDAMTTTTINWVNKTLSLMGMINASFNSDIAGKNLKLTFDKPLLENSVLEKQLFRSLAHLVMSSLRNQYKQEIKDLKIVFIRPE